MIILRNGSNGGYLLTHRVLYWLDTKCDAASNNMQNRLTFVVVVSSHVTILYGKFRYYTNFGSNHVARVFMA